MQPRSSCIVIADLKELERVESHDSRAHILYCGSASISQKVLQRLRGKNFELTSLAECTSPPEFCVPNLYIPSFPDFSDRIRHALVRLYQEKLFSRIEFGVFGGLGFRTIQAKKAGVAFNTVELSVRLNSCSTLQREQEQRWPTSYEEIEVDFAERFSFENADKCPFPKDELRKFVRRLEWAEPNSVQRPKISKEAPSPLISIGIAHYNLGRYLPDTLALIAGHRTDRSSYRHRRWFDRTLSVKVFEEMAALYPQWQFVKQANGGIGATRNRCLAAAQGEFFIPMDADNIARPEMAARFVDAIRRNTDMAAMTCYFLAFDEEVRNPPTRFLYAHRPTGGPHVLASIRNVYGDANAVFRTANPRSRRL